MHHIIVDYISCVMEQCMYFMYINIYIYSFIQELSILDVHQILVNIISNSNV